MNERNRTSSSGAWTVIMILALTYGLLAAADAALANVRVNQNAAGLDEHTTSIALHPDPQGGPDLLIVGYDQNPFGFNGIGTSWSPDQGVTWFDSAMMPAPIFNVNLDASVASDRMGVIFAGFSSYDALPPMNMGSGIFVSTSFDGGVTFNPPAGVSVMNGLPGAMPWETKPKVDADGYFAAGSPYAGNAYVIWERDQPTTGWLNGPSDAAFSRSLDQGATWSQPIPVNDTPGNDFVLWPDVDVGSDGSIAAGWVDTPFWLQHQGTFVFDRSTDGGVTFGQDVPAVTFWCVPQQMTDQTAIPGQNSRFAQSYVSVAVDPSNPRRIGAVFAGDPDTGPAGEARVDTGDVPSSFDAYLLNPTSGASIMGHTSTKVHACWSDGRGMPDVYHNSMALGTLPPAWSPVENVLSTQPAFHHRGANNVNMATTGTGVYVAWDEWVGIDYTHLIYVNCSNDEGTTWLPQAVNLDHHGRVCTEPWITANSRDHVVVAWLEQQITQPDVDIYVNWSPDGGATWQANEVEVPTTYRAFDHDICSWYDFNTGNNMVYVVWAEATATGANSIIRFSVSSDGGATWAAPTRLDASPAGTELCFAPKICAEFGNVYVSWVDGSGPVEDIKFAWSANHGLSGWTPEVQLDQPTSRGYYPQMACGQGNVYVVYESDRNALGGNEDIYCNFSVGGGSSWQGERRVDTDAPANGHSVYPRVSVGGADGFPTPTVVWMDDRNGPAPFSGWDAYSNMSADGGYTWGQDFRVDTGDQPGQSDTWYPHVDGITPIYVYRDERNGIGDVYSNVYMFGPDEGDIFYTESTDGGATWLNPPLRVNDDTGWNDQSHPWIDIKPNGIVDVVWYDDRGDPQDRNPETWFAALLPGATAFTPNQPVSNQPIVAPAGQFWIGDYIGVCVDESLAHVAWADDRRELTLFDAFYANVENPQLEPLGACCLPTGECAELTAGECGNLGGIYMGDGIPCDPYPCQGTGVDDGPPLPPSEGRLQPNVPNPFNPSTLIRFELGGALPVKLTVHDAAGRQVRDLLRSPLLPGGEHEVRWDGRDGSGRMAAAGVYIVKLEAGEEVDARRIVLLK